MSAGRFVKAKYETDAGVVHNIRIQPETLTAVNAQPAGGVTGNVTVKARGSRRSIGIVARKINLEWTGTAPAGYDARGNPSVPILTPALFFSMSVGNTFTYLGAEARIIGLSPESRR